MYLHQPAFLQQYEVLWVEPSTPHRSHTYHVFPTQPNQTQISELIKKKSSVRKKNGHNCEQSILQKNIIIIVKVKNFCKIQERGKAINIQWEINSNSAKISKMTSFCRKRIFELIFPHLGTHWISSPCAGTRVQSSPRLQPCDQLNKEKIIVYKCYFSNHHFQADKVADLCVLYGLCELFTFVCCMYFVSCVHMCVVCTIILCTTYVI